MQTHLLGYPRIGSNRELKKACEQYWAGKTSIDQLLETGNAISHQNWKLQHDAGIDLIPCNDFSYYDQVLDMTLTIGAIPERYQEIASDESRSELDLYFAMARGYQKNGLDITAMEMTKWFDTNYHYIVPEFQKNQSFKLFSNKIINEFISAKQAGINAKPVIIGLITYLLLGKEKEENFDKLDLVSNLLPVYIQILTELENQGAEYIQFDEPFLALDLDNKAKEAYELVYNEIRKQFPNLKIIVATYFEGLKDNTSLAVHLPVDVLHIDLVRNPEQLEEILPLLPRSLSLSLGIVDGRNIWKNDFEKSLQLVKKVIHEIGTERILIAPSCSLLHSPFDLDSEKDEAILSPEIKEWLAFAKQKVHEVVALKKLANNPDYHALQLLAENKKAIETRKVSTLIHNQEVKNRIAIITEDDAQRRNPFNVRKEIQQKELQLPLFPTTTIGSFPQTKEVRSWRAQFKKGELTAEQYDTLLKQETERTIHWQEEIGIDVLVHGEFERNDMVEYFGEQLSGFAFTQNGWVQSYGSRCVKPPVIYGDVHRPHPMTVYWSEYAQSVTKKWVKGMLTGPVTILQWSFVRDDQPRSSTCKQIALAIRDEVNDLEKAGIRIIQIDEPAIREGLPLRKSEWQTYLKWAVEAFRISASGVEDATQIHTHMCYSEFNDIIQNIADMDADVITIECSRSQMELLNAFADFKYPNEIGPGVYDIHSPRVPSKEEMVALLRKAQAVIPAQQLWVNPDCGLKTRHWDETEKALKAMVEASREASLEYAVQEK
ncbi:5-methyltetrahydropteroyltriglutamate--homocysteine S-methyltransferase [Chryseobacterium lactis]|uniref:5-methyltetrahydropteroyltriglutamate--homocysteine methyltransferase n=1 Tax=Chryseobacterium lactis TaxID=1241981 RepID=A0A3G6RH75_CHRLC|nr:5-methyltetrahydropteroyltriglutamate--homocysteine S-methyltransferase [Chryseobacterium lactis]AZA83935.1 5-methyltetrahydropteroyltriglutamate--homocysteine S-methyltransferase [Chryseobacterium lactis]AZB04321.1 5-methyltetrahydropteroyltriglutamate--homocysteine S-methyltransferase [Chryseobacterium lactis]PNW12767.1 5-methyltetrahydropteroyltriglutamate--homocysteine S-methyltransferase [Chryseobacterium lactis]